MTVRCQALSSTMIGGLATFLMLLPASVGAQTSPSVQPATSTVPKIEEVTVTAEKRTSTVQKTAIAMEVFTAKALAANNITDMSSLAQISPTLNIASDGPRTILTIRGVSSRDTTEIGDSAVSVSIDGFYLQRALALNAGIFDLARVEVLRGPQGTLYGRNSTGGAINFVTAKPTKDYGGEVSVEYGNYNELVTSAVANVPVSDKVQVRAAFQSASHDGYEDNAPSGHGDDQDDKSGRLTIKAEPTDRLTVMLTGEITHSGGLGPVVDGYPLQFLPDGSINHALEILPTDRTFPLNYRGFQDITNKSARWNAVYDFGPVQLTYLGGYRTSNYHHDYDVDGTASTSTNIGFRQDEDERTQSHELRLSSPGTDRLTYQVGGYYFEDKNNLKANFENFLTVPTSSYAEFLYPNVEAQSYAAFAQGGYKIFDNVKVEGGVRYSHDHKIRTGNQITGAGVAINEDNAASFSKVTWHGALEWQYTPVNLAYVKVDTGYKSGGFNDTTAYGPESLISYEAGSKNRFWNNRIELNADIFMYVYTDQQVSEYIDPAIGTLTQNVGKSQAYGGEAEGIVHLTPIDQFDFNVAYDDAHYQSFVYDKTTGANYNGNRAIQAPRWILAAGLQHDWAVLDGVLNTRVQTRYESRSEFSYQNYADQRQGQYTKTDLLISYTPNQSRWSASAYIKNMENSLVLSAASEGDFYGTYQYQFLDPRTYGVRLAYKF